MENNSALPVPAATEDSVDIYDGLDVCASGSIAESPRAGSRLKESMDLYEQLVTEEEQNKEASYAELKSRFKAAQNQIQELRHRLEQMEMKNSGLSKENCCLKKNISALLQTARQEVKRKDAEILRLTQRSEKPLYHLQPRINQQDPYWSGGTSSITSSSKPQRQPPPPALPTCSRPPDPAPTDPAQACRRENTDMTRASRQSSHGHSRRDCEGADKHKSKCKEKHQCEKLSETTDRRHRTASDSNKQFATSEQNRSYRVEGRRRDHPKLSNSETVNLEDQSRSEGAKDYSSEVSRRYHSEKNGSTSVQRKPDKTKTTKSESNRSALRSSREIYSREREERKNRSSDKQSDSKEQRKGSRHAERYRDCSKERKENRDKNHQIKGDRCGAADFTQRSSQSEMSKEQKKQRSREEKDRTLKMFPKESAEGKKSIAEENSPNRKLCFMETLNLTLSPIKKPWLSGSDLPAGQEIKTTPDEDNSMPCLEDMCVIDEIDVNESERALSEVCDPLLNSHDASTSQKIPEHMDCGKDVQETGMSSHSQLKDTVEYEGAVLPEPKPPVSISCVAVKDLQTRQENVSVDCENQADGRESQAPQSPHPNDTSEQQTHCHLQKMDSGNDRNSFAPVPEPVDSSTKPLNPAIHQSYSPDLPRQIAVLPSPPLILPPPHSNVSEGTTISTRPKSKESPAVSLNGCPQEAGPPAPPPQDAGSPPAPPPQEAGSSPASPGETSPPPAPPQDAGSPPAPPQDASPYPPPAPPEDAGPPPAPPEDAGPYPLPPPPEDAGPYPLPPPPEDAGPPPTPPEDAGAPRPPPRDAGPDPPPAPPEETGPPPPPPKDAGPPPAPPEDAGPYPLPPPPEETGSPPAPPKEAGPYPPPPPPKDAGPPPAPPEEAGSPRPPPRDAGPDPPPAPPEESGPPPDPPRDAGRPPAFKNQSSRRWDTSKDPTAVPNIISLESLPQEGLSLTEAILALAHEDGNDSPVETSSSSGSTGVFHTSSTAKDKVPEKFDHPPVTPQKTFSPTKKQELSSSVPLTHDEDSMMRTLSSLKRIPDAISPLRSPVQITKRSHAHLHGKASHVKSLQKDFSSAPADANSMKLDINKENKYPGSPVNCGMSSLSDKVLEPSSGLSDSDLEEGEIESETDEAAACCQIPATKKAKLTLPNKASPKSVLKRKHEEKCGASKDTPEAAGASTRSPRSRFKTVCPAATKASFSTVDDIMETFRLVRAEIRKKYMKLHKTFPKKSFYGVMENFQESFLEFVDGAHFGQICSHAGQLKSKLKNLITFVFGKVSNNGIVKRIFEQQAVDMKQKLWDFVDAQVGYLFREIDATLQSLCKPNQNDDKKHSGRNRSSRPSPKRKSNCQQTEAQSPPIGQNSTRPGTYKTGLGSRGKDIRIIHADKEGKADWNTRKDPQSQAVVERPPLKSPSLTPEKNRAFVVSHNGPLVDKTDFQLLTEQQASSLTFNLVRDSQMGEIFKCLLQGSDLLESSGENGAWTFASPRKDGEKCIGVTTPTKFDSPSKLFTPIKVDTPSKLVAAWASISPRKLSSPCLKEPVHLNPALFDESCMLEVPSESGVQAQKSYSILAEDLAVSLTIPSPLKSDSHLSFLQPSSTSMHLMSTPDSVISAHISEDALMDGEDATEQDIHLALDTDNSSCDPSSGSGPRSPLATPFVFKPDVPMQALVMERSNDHFIVKIRQASGSVTLTEEDSLDRTITEEPQHAERQNQSNTGSVEKPPELCRSSSAVPHVLNPSNLPEPPTISQATTASQFCRSHEEKRKVTKVSSHKANASTPGPSHSPSLNKAEALPDDTLDSGCQNSHDDTVVAEESEAVGGDGGTLSNVVSPESLKTISSSEGSGVGVQQRLQSPDAADKAGAAQSDGPESNRNGTKVPGSERGLTAAEDLSSSPQKSREDHNKSKKRKKHQKKSKAKRCKEEEEKGKASTDQQGSQASLSPSSLSAKNLVRKKGEVVIAWTRDEDRAILIALKTKGASRDTFLSLSEKLHKPSEQIAHRFHQLMKLFKKMDF